MAMDLNIKDFTFPGDLERYRLAVREPGRTGLDPLAIEMEDTARIPDKMIPLLERRHCSG